MELNREEIIKDLECCKFGKDEAKCKECNWHPWIKPRCWRLLASNALTLIKQLTEENERLKADVVPRSEVEVRHGEWIEHMHFGFEGGYSGANYECSNCHYDDCYEETPYCPNCGAKMKGVE